MKKEILITVKIIVIILIGCIIADIILGIVTDKLLNYVPKTSTFLGRTKYTMFDSKDDCILLGASNVSRNYNSNLLSDSLDLTVYNNGYDGSDFSFQYTMIKNIVKRYSPQLIILDMPESTLYRDIQRNYTLQLFMKKDSISYDILEQTLSKKTAKLMKYVNFYRLKIAWEEILEAYIATKDTLDGFMPLPVTNYNWDIKEPEKMNNKLNPQEVYYLKQIFEICKSKNIKLICISSPILIRTNGDSEFGKLCRAENIHYIDNRNIDCILKDPLLFKDHNHLNKNGADLYSKIVSAQIKNILNNNYYTCVFDK